MPKYEVVISTHGYERHTIEADSEEDAKEKVGFGMGDMKTWEYGMHDGDSNNWKVYPSEE